MWSILLVTLTIAYEADVLNAIILDRNQLIAWYPNYLHANAFSLQRRQITSISADTFIGLSQLKELDLQYNQLSTLEASIFAGLSGLQKLSLRYNQLTSVDPSTFSELSQLLVLEFSVDGSISL